MILPVRGEHRMNIETLEYANAFESKYAQAYLLNDPAHVEDHFREVLHNCLMLHRRLYGEDSSLSQQKMYVAASYLHDLFAWSRHNHHVLSATYVRTSDCKLLDGFTPEEREQVALMCEQHRASFTGEFDGLNAELFNAADLGKPDLSSDVARAYKYAKANAPMLDHSQWLHTARQHMVEKFSRGGYARRGQLYMIMYGTELEKYWDAIEKWRE